MKRNAYISNPDDFNFLLFCNSDKNGVDTYNYLSMGALMSKTYCYSFRELTVKPFGALSPFCPIHNYVAWAYRTRIV